MLIAAVQTGHNLQLHIVGKKNSTDNLPMQEQKLKHQQKHHFPCNAMQSSIVRHILARPLRVLPPPKYRKPSSYYTSSPSTYMSFPIKTQDSTASLLYTSGIFYLSFFLQGKGVQCKAFV
jgi:hypothetical protein